MADSLHNRQQIDDAEYDNIARLYQSADTDKDWETLSRLVDRALANPLLPRYYRVEYEVIHACTADDPADHIQRAKDIMKEMHVVPIADDQDNTYIRDRLFQVEGKVAAIEQAPKGEHDDEE